MNFDDDLYELLKQRARESGQSLRQVINDALRLGLRDNKPLPRNSKLPTFRMGLRQGLSYDNVGELLERIDGPFS